jgi:hypothetical protein
MINPKTQERELCYIARITKITPIEGADNIELVTINDGWVCIAKIGEFKVDDLCIYFEIDSKLPEAEWSEFLASKHYKVKTMKLGKFKVISQGLALPVSTFGWELSTTGQFAGDVPIIITNDNTFPYFAEGDFLTSYLGVTYSVIEDNKRKAPSADKYKKMAQRHPKIFQKPFVKWLYKKDWGKKFLFVFFGKKKDTRNWPQWVVKTDEERIQNMPWILQDKEEWFATEKIDGTSTTFTMKRGGFLKNNEYYVCSRNVVFDTPNKNCFYDSNVYLEMAEKYHIKEALTKMLVLDDTLDFVTIQGETYGTEIQKRDYGLKDHKLAVFNVILGEKGEKPIRLNPKQMVELMDIYNIPCVPIIDEHFILPDTIEELLTIATDKSKIDGGMREGLVFRSYDGTKSFRAVSNEFLLKYHQ